MFVFFVFVKVLGLDIIGFIWLFRLVFGFKVMFRVRIGVSFRDVMWIEMGKE